MGRKKKKEGEKLENTINLKVEYSTHKDLLKISKELGISMSGIIRANILKQIKEVKKNGEWHPENFVK
ncbi:MAG: hypothetical protein LKF87_12340 [Clostridium tyrobutyricum]|uniref:hypothetical protein n=1 Tax=Clostridium tyrobutyricum TaxID=1519 RepID=UPI00242B463C|nr:hypothetical protein [Clostridium tyrobutyricum]MCH4200147.1 hypothetical protein [Clostridium tyrobutyricum]MCH4237919.1 hypothetical protein [Clostridium tyrobutyricum]MCH4259715.1 hypothetical protein [Clostridium tyrobutyricum]